MRFHKSVAELKHDVLANVVDDILVEKYGENFENIEQIELLKQKLKALKQDD